MKKFTILLLAILTVAAVFLPSCREEITYPEEEIRSALKDLLPRSYELNVVYFGEGLPISEDRELLDKFYNSFDSDVEMINYHPVSADCSYQTESALRDATLAVFTEDYSEYLFQRAFAGISGQLQNIEGETVTHSAMYAMYIEQNGVLTVRLNLADEAIPLGREFSVDEMTVKSQKRGVVVVEMPTYYNGELDFYVEVRLVMTENGWRLDSPTY
ncbi:MAG: hypothetical protein J6L96_06830 [Clostridia bacterium]|nr:hypothetical protein [Clostridia bacterium]